MDSRSSRFTNKPLIDQWIRDYGEDSDWCRVRIFGLPPKASELQFTDRERVEGARARQERPLDDDPLVVGVDVSGGGSAWNVIRFRRGIDARTKPPIRIPGDHGRERQVLITKCADLLSEKSRANRITAMFIDSAFGAPIYERLRALEYQNFFEIAFGDPSPDKHYANMRAFMWDRMKDWLATGMIDATDERLSIDLTAPGYKINRSSQLVIEAKEEVIKRLGHSPDDGDALALTFARKVAVPQKTPEPLRTRTWIGANPRVGWMATEEPPSHVSAKAVPTNVRVSDNPPAGPGKYYGVTREQ